MNDAMTLIVTCAFGLEAIVKRELSSLGHESRVISPGRIELSGDKECVIDCNLRLRCADRVLIEMGRFEAADFDALFETTRDMSWDKWIPVDGEFPVKGRSHDSQLSSVPACQRAVKKAIVESLLSAHGVSELPESGAMYQVEIAIQKNQASLTIDTTGPSLHKRGYRVQSSAAPLKETMAAALVQLSFWNSGRPLLDPFCGTGTILIEAAMIGRHMSPGLNRSFSCELWPAFSAELWRSARERAASEIMPKMEERLLGTDVDERALWAARENAKAAGVEDDLHFQKRDFLDTTSKRKHGCVITNPPYGDRLGEFDELHDLYQSFPVVLRNLKTWSHFILTAYPAFESLVGKQADRRRKLYNGRIECTYFQFHGPNPRQSASPHAIHDESAGKACESTAAPAAESTEESTDASMDATRRPPRRSGESRSSPVFGGITEKGREQSELFRSRLLKRARHLRRWPTRRGITCFRLYDRDIPEIPLVVDRYGDHLHVSEFERPHDRDPGQHADWLDLMAKTAAESLDVKPERVFLKRRLRQRGTDQHQRQSDKAYSTQVQEDGLSFLVNLTDYVDTGLFLDHRILRKRVRDEARGTRFLNLFAYTGSFSVYAAAGEALTTTSVDWSRTYLTWASTNLKQNGFDGSAHQYIATDVMQFLRDLPVKPLFDLAVVDPPTFSNSKRSDQVWDVQKNHVECLNELLARMARPGKIYFSTNSRRFKLEEQSILSDAIHEISRQTVPEDFRNRRIHRCWQIDVS